MRLTIAIIMLFAFANTADQIPHLESFDVQRYLGTWYEAARSKNIIFERGEHVHAEYSDRGNGTINVFNTGRLEDGKENSIKGHAEPDGSGIPGRLSLVFDNWFGRFSQPLSFVERELASPAGWRGWRAGFSVAAVNIFPFSIFLLMPNCPTTKHICTKDD